MKINPLNVSGKYYVDIDNCTWCGMCEVVAPANFKLPEDYQKGSYVYKQPENFQEEAQCKEAVFSCPHEAILNNGETKNL